MTIAPELSIDVAPGLDAAPPGMPVEPAWDQPGGLGIRERQAWATWQLVAAAALALLVGMFIGYSGKKPSSSAGGAGSPLVSLTGGPASSPTTATSTPAAAPTTGGSTPGAAPTTGDSTPATEPAPGAGGTTETTAATTAPAAGPAVVLVANKQGQGPADLASFHPAGAWTIGWQFQCLQTPTGTGTFSVVAVPDDGSTPASPPAIEKTGREDKGVTGQSTVGSQHLRITTDAACRWAIKVTGAGA